MRRSGSGKGAFVGILAVIGIIIFICSRGSLSTTFQTIGTILLVLAIIAVVIIGLIVFFAARAFKKIPKGNASSSKVKLNEEQAAIINNGRQDLMAIRRKLVTIKNSTIRTKGNEVCSSMDRVFKILREKPDKIPSTRQFLNYYLPTVSKVIQKYQRLEANGVPTADMVEKMATFLDDVKEAMDKQCSHLLEDDKLDMTVDMEAMTMAIQRDGLLDPHDFQTPGAEGFSTVADDFRKQSEQVAQQNAQSAAAQAPQETAQPSAAQTPQAVAQPSAPQTPQAVAQPSAPQVPSAGAETSDSTNTPIARP